MEERDPGAVDDTTDDASTAPATDQAPRPPDDEPGEPDRYRYGPDGRCRPHGNPWRCPRCLADVSDVSVFNNT